MGGWIVADQSVGVAYLFFQSTEGVGACLDRSGGRGIQPEMRYGLPLNDIIMVVQDDDDLGSVLEYFDGGIGRDENISDKENELKKGTELESPVMAGEIDVLTRPQAQVESQDD